jgi:hypothetical protein
MNTKCLFDSDWKDGWVRFLPDETERRHEIPACQYDITQIKVMWLALRDVLVKKGLITHDDLKDQIKEMTERIMKKAKEKEKSSPR